MRSFLVIGFLVWSCAIGTGAEFKLTNGEILSGEAVLPTANDQGIQIKVGEGQYQKVPWSSFSQEDLKSFAANAKIEPFVQPFIEIDPLAKIKKTEVNIKEPPRLSQPARQSLLAALFSSSLGLLLVFLVYAANVYAAYEVSIFRAQRPSLVCGLAAIPGLGLLATIAFLAMPTKLKPSETAQVAGEPAAAPAGTAAAASSDADINPMHADGVAHPAGLKLADSEPEKPKSALPETIIFKRGAFTFNRRFIETKFPGFFGIVRRDADRDLVLVIKSTRGEYHGQRISRIAASDLHLQVQKGHATEEVLIPFQEIQEIRLQHKDA